MIVLNVGHVKKAFAGEVVLEDVTLVVRQREKVALVGQNGSGKSTLLKIIAGKLAADAGTIAVRKEVKVGYLPQEAQFATDNTLYDEMEMVFHDVLDTEARLRELEQEMGRPEVYNCPDLLSQKMREYSSLTHFFEQQEGFQIKAKINSVLLGLGFSQDQYTQRVATMSGGEKTRVLLARLLLQAPDLLLMDEPTNHLDVQAIQWLESYLKDYPGAVLIVSHDRFFLDETVSRVYDLVNGRCQEYEGNYSDFMTTKQTQLLIQQANWQAQQKELERLERSWKQTLAWAHQARSHKLKVKADNIKRRLDRIQRIDRPQLDPERIRLELEANRRSGKEVLTVTGLSKSFPGRQLFSNVSLQVRLGDKVAIVGPNGIGKSTLLRIIMGLIEADGGEVKIGANVSIAYYDQQHLQLDPDKTCFQEIMDTKRMTNLEARNLLAQFMFLGDDVFKTIGQLSGGEKSRLQLAKLTITDANLVILDEPTNHLDIPSTEVLERSLSDFNGTVIFISHDRYFINQVATKVAELTPQGIKLYEGNYDVYLEEKAREEAQRLALAEAAKASQPTKVSAPTPLTQESSTKQLQRQITELEEVIADLETKIEELEQQLMDPQTLQDPDQLAEISREHKASHEELDLLYQRWEDLTEQLA
ncbi:MAG: ABC-F type ribosomal protection protein [Firmicutes bacterium]|nr:ABC-F type ribosomal protection protein [Bacillota bacterium]